MNTLEEDILIQIGLNLGLTDVLNLSCTCSLLNLMNSENFWRNRAIQDFNRNIRDQPNCWKTFFQSLHKIRNMLNQFGQNIIKIHDLNSRIRKKINRCEEEIVQFQQIFNQMNSSSSEEDFEDSSSSI